MSIVYLIGRILFSALFIIAGPGEFQHKSIDYASQAGVPFATILVPLAGVIAILGGLSILLGYKMKVGAWLIVIFLVPVTLFIHKFWGLSDTGAATIQQIMFFKNISMIGAALMFAYYGAGPYSIDGRAKKDSKA